MKRLIIKFIFIFGVASLLLPATVQGAPTESDDNLPTYNNYDDLVLNAARARHRKKKKIYYKVKKGDNLSEIASKYNLPLKKVIKANPEISNPNLIHPGQIIRIPKTSSSHSNSTTSRRGDNPIGRTMGSNGSRRPNNMVEALGGTSRRVKTHRVQKGENLSEIAKRYGLSIPRLLGANPNISNPNRIYPGQKIVIPGQSSMPEAREENNSPRTPRRTSTEEYTPTSKKTFALDISHWSGRLKVSDVEAWKSKGVTHVIVGTQDKSIARQQLTMLVQRGVKVHAYVYLKWRYDMGYQVKKALDIIKGFPVGRLWLDIEDKPGGRSAATLKGKIRQAIRACGNQACGIYTGAWWWKAYVNNTTEFSHLPLWYARYDNNPSLSTWSSQKFGGWKKPWGKQYKGNTYLGGARPIVDLNTIHR